MAAGEMAVVRAESAEARADEEALKVIGSSKEPKGMAVVVSLVRPLMPTMTEAEIKAAVWRLHSKGLIDVSADWKFLKRP